MKKITLAFTFLLIPFSTAFSQTPEIIKSDLEVSNAYLNSAVMDGIYFFVGHDGDYDYELWRTDGTEGGTYRVIDINPDKASYPGNLTVVGDKLFFTAKNTTAINQLYSTDGTEAGTQWVADVDSLGMELYYMFTAVDDLLYFRTYRPGVGVELWVSDGTTENTMMVADICERQSFPHELLNFGGILVFVAEDCEASGSTLYKLETFPGDIQKIGGHYPRGIMRAENELFFSTIFEDYGDELAYSAEGLSSVSMIIDISPGLQGSNIHHLTQVDSMIFFRAYHPDYGAELWALNLNSWVVDQVKDINPGMYNSSFPSQLISYNGKLIFSANDGEYGEEPWISDGTTDGTFMLKNISEEYHSYPAKFFEAGGTLFFVANDFTHGSELWQTDGTEEGTTMVDDIWPSGSQGSDVGAFGITEDYLVFNAWYNKRTLFRLDIETIGINEEFVDGNSFFSVYPNPAQTELTIKNRSMQGFEYRLTDITGRELTHGEIKNMAEMKLNITKLQPGLYFIQAQMGVDQFTQKIIVN